MTGLRAFAVLYLSSLIRYASTSTTRQAFRPPNNPILSDEPMLADPHVLEYNDSLYLYPTSNEADFIVFTYDLTSKDAQFVKQDTPIFTPKASFLGMFDFDLTYCPLSWTAFGKHNLAWAPHVFNDVESGLFYLYYTACLSIGVAVSESPLGPFRHESILCRFCIDAFVERFDSQLYFYHNQLFDSHRSTLRQWMKRLVNAVSFSSQITVERQQRQEEEEGNTSQVGFLGIYGQRMISPTHLDTTHSAIKLVQASEDWEFQSSDITSTSSLDKFLTSSLGVMKGVNEGAWVFRRDNHGEGGDEYVLMYSGGGANSRHYRLGFAAGPSPLGPFTKSSTNPIIQFRDIDDPIYGPGHHALWKDPVTDKVWCFYHAKYSAEVGWERYISVDELVISEGSEYRMSLKVSLDDGVLNGQQQGQCGEENIK